MKRLKKENLISESLMFTIGTILYLFSQWLISVVIVNVTGLEDAGYFGLAMTITSVFYIFASYGVRSYQISDVNSVYSDNVYVYSRLFTTLAAFLLVIIFSFAMKYDSKQVLIIVFYMLFKCIESIYDVFHGILQKNGMLISVGVSLSIKGLLGFIAFLIPYIITENIVISILAMTMVSSVLLIIDIIYTCKCVGTDLLKISNYKTIAKFLKATFVMMLIISCVPLFNTIPRIVLEKVQSKEILGIYTSLATPAVIISTFASTAFLPLVPKNVEAYENRRKSELRSMLLLPICILVGISIVACIMVRFIGHWAFNLVYGEIVASYYEFFYGFILNVLITSIIVILKNFCTGIRKLKQELLFIIVGCISCLILSLVLIPIYSMAGAIASMIIAQLIQLIMLSLYVGKLIKKLD